MDEKYFEIKDAILATGLKPFVMEEICRNANTKGLAYLSKDKTWMVHSCIVDDLKVILSGKKDFKPENEN